VVYATSSLSEDSSPYMNRKQSQGNDRKNTATKTSRSDGWWLRKTSMVTIEAVREHFIPFKTWQNL